VLNNGQIDCLLPRSAVGFFDQTTGRLTDAARSTLLMGSSINSGGGAVTHRRGATSSSAVTLARFGEASSSTPSSSAGTFELLRRIFRAEGLAGIYAGLRPTLVMAVPNTVLYFSAYDELVYRLRSYSSSGECDRNSNSHVGASSWIPLAAGGGARLLASWVTAPFEFLRTRQASLVGAGAASQPSLGMVGEFRTIVEANGFGALYRGLRPTLWRDVPFSAIYWLCVERMRLVWIDHGPAGRIVSPTEQAGQAFMNGAVSGMIAACFTTPFDVLKTRQQQQLQLQSHPPETFAEGRVSLSSKAVSARAVACSHDGAIVFETQAQAQQPSTLASLRQIARTEGVSALWRGNQARMLKVAPACAIMISSYDLGKRILLDER
jgi:solute carrier family 25 protein 39/40